MIFHKTGGYGISQLNDDLSFCKLDVAGWQLNDLIRLLSGDRQPHGKHEAQTVAEWLKKFHNKSNPINNYRLVSKRKNFCRILETQKSKKPRIFKALYDSRLINAPMSKTAEADSIITKEAKKRRTFAIISHPDAGKTTLTEKLLLYGGAIHEAGSVRARKAAHHAASDWMAIEKERGISVTSSVMRFEKDGIKYNLLDTPGHKDFSEDTLRTLVAADSGLMVIDVAKGVEEQTEKLFEVCKLREVPVITFVNKCDRPGMDPLEVLSNVENKLGIEALPAAWPMGYGQKFQGIYDVLGKKVHVYE